MKENSGFDERDALQRVSFTRIDATAFANILKRTKILDFSGSVTASDKAYWSQNLNVSMWLNTVISAAANRYLIDLLFYSKCVNLSPTALLDLKMSEEPKQRYFSS